MLASAAADGQTGLSSSARKSVTGPSEDTERAKGKLLSLLCLLCMRWEILAEVEALEKVLVMRGWGGASSSGHLSAAY